MPSALLRRIKRLDASRQEARQRRYTDTLRTLRASMAPEHLALFEDWMREHCGGLVVTPRTGESWIELLRRLQPPTLVRAAWLMLAAHLHGGCPVSLAPDVAEVYLSDGDAFPAAPCDGCGYLMPIRGRIHPDNTYDHIGSYVGTCPVCEHNNQPEEEATA